MWMSIVVYITVLMCNSSVYGCFYRSEDLQKENTVLKEKLHHLDDMLKSQQRKLRTMIEQVHSIYTHTHTLTHTHTHTLTHTHRHSLTHTLWEHSTLLSYWVVVPQSLLLRMYRNCIIRS